MNTTLHEILDGEPSTDAGGEGKLFQLPEERQEFLEHGKLREAMRQNADVDGLTSAEKGDIYAGLAAAIGLAPAGAPAAIAGAGASFGSSWIVKSLAAMILGIALGAGLFMLTDREPEAVQQKIGIPVQTIVPSAIPYGSPEPLPGAQCDSLVDQLRDSLRILQSQQKSPVKKRGRAKWMPDGGPPVPGEQPPAVK